MVAVGSRFSRNFSNKGTTSDTDHWFDMLSGYTLDAVPYSPIPTGKRIWLGFCDVGADSKTIVFELRVNNPGVGTATEGSTVLLGGVTVPTGESRTMDFDMQGSIYVPAPPNEVAPSTGVEKLWLRARAGSNSASGFWYIIRFNEV